MSDLKPPFGYQSWLEYAVATMDTRTLHLQSICEEGEPDSWWGRVVQRDEMVEAARCELREKGSTMAKKSDRKQKKMWIENKDLKEQLLELLQVGADNAIVASALSKIMRLHDGITSEELRKLIREMIIENLIPIGSCSKGFYILEIEKELENNEAHLDTRILGMIDRKRGLRAAWKKHKGKKPESLD